jgi:GT2 family glycosyltransferase
MLSKLERQAAWAARHPTACVVARQTYRFEGPVPSWFRGPTDGSPDAAFVPSAWFIARTIWNMVGPFDERLTHAEDVDWLARARDLGVSSVMVPEALVQRRIHDRNATGMAAESRGGVLAAMRAAVQRKREAQTDA